MSVISNTFDLNNIKNKLFREANFKIPVKIYGHLFLRWSQLSDHDVKKN